MSRFDIVSRRSALGTLAAAAAALALPVFAPARVSEGGQGFALPPLPYAPDALEPFIDARTMEIHHGRHHQGYVQAANRALASVPAFAGLGFEAILGRLEEAPEGVRAALRNQLGGHANHVLFWESLSPRGGGAAGGRLGPAIDAAFGSWEAFRMAFTQAAMGRFGSGWAWLVLRDGRLAVESSANQDSPFMNGGLPLVGLDVWEHAYYLHYQNRRADYVGAFWKIADWDAADRRYRAVTS